jgi:hypothetical protein
VLLINELIKDVFVTKERKKKRMRGRRGGYKQSRIEESKR